MLEPFLSKEGTTKISFKTALDEMLMGGLETKTITQLYGPPASGKTNLCLLDVEEWASHGIEHLDGLLAFFAKFDLRGQVERYHDPGRDKTA